LSQAEQERRRELERLEDMRRQEQEREERRLAEIARRKEEEEAQKEKVRKLVQELVDLGVPEARGIEPGEGAQQAIERLIKEKHQAEERKLADLNRRIESRFRRVDFLTRAMREEERLKVPTVQADLMADIQAHTSTTRAALAKAAEEEHTKKLALRSEFEVASGAWESLVAWISARSEARWAEAMVSHCRVSVPPSSSRCALLLFVPGARCMGALGNSRCRRPLMANIDPPCDSIV
jgi:hypothetical protein